MGLDDHYATLRVAPDADGRAIRSADRGLMRRYHPDVDGSPGAGARAIAINEAYACLRDPSKRAQYDRDRGAATKPTPRRRPPPPPPPPPDMSWTVADAGGWRRPRLGRPSWWQAFALGGATIVTAIIFSATSATPGFSPPDAAMAVTYVRSVDSAPTVAEAGRRGNSATTTQ